MTKRENKTSCLGILIAIFLAILLLTAILLLRLLAPKSGSIPMPISTTETILPSITLSLVSTQSFTVSPSTTITLGSITASASPSVSPTFEASETSIVQKQTPVPNPTLVKTPVGTNLPARFRIDAWHNDYVPCDKLNYTVQITGVEISYATARTSDYQFTFWQFENEYRAFVKSISEVDPNKELVTFDEPIILSKGRYIHVVLVYKSGQQDVTWIDDLYFPFSQFNSECN